MTGQERLEAVAAQLAEASVALDNAASFIAELEADPFIEKLDSRLLEIKNDAMQARRISENAMAHVERFMAPPQREAVAA